MEEPGGKGGIRERGIAIEKALRECKERASTESERKRDREGSGGGREKKKREKEKERERGRGRGGGCRCAAFFSYTPAPCLAACVRVHMYARQCACVWGRCIIVSAGSWLGGPVDISGLRCSCLSGSRTQR